MQKSPLVFVGVSITLTLLLLIGFVLWPKREPVAQDQNPIPSPSEMRQLPMPVPSPSQPVQPNSTPRSSSPSSADMMGWKTYQNEKYGFEVRYPNSFDVSMRNDDNITFWQQINLAEDLTQENVFQIGIISIPQQYKKSFFDDLEQNINFSIGNLKAVRKIRSNTPYVHIEEITFVNGEQFFIMTLKSNTSGDIEVIEKRNEAGGLTSLKQILATFKFIR